MTEMKSTDTLIGLQLTVLQEKVSPTRKIDITSSAFLTQMLFVLLKHEKDKVVVVTGFVSLFLNIYYCFLIYFIFRFIILVNIIVAIKFLTNNDTSGIVWILSKLKPPDSILTKSFK